MHSFELMNSLLLHYMAFDIWYKFLPRRLWNVCIAISAWLVAEDVEEIIEGDSWKPTVGHQVSVSITVSVMWASSHYTHLHLITCTDCRFEHPPLCQMLFRNWCAIIFQYIYVCYGTSKFICILLYAVLYLTL